jgi:hypothetical protein
VKTACDNAVSLIQSLISKLDKKDMEIKEADRKTTKTSRRVFWILFLSGLFVVGFKVWEYKSKNQNTKDILGVVTTVFEIIAGIVIYAVTAQII